MHLIDFNLFQFLMFVPILFNTNQEFHQILDYIKKWDNDLYFLSELDKEILKTYLSIDDDYIKECNSITQILFLQLKRCKNIVFNFPFPSF